MDLIGTDLAHIMSNLSCQILFDEKREIYSVTPAFCLLHITPEKNLDLDMYKLDTNLLINLYNADRELIYKIGMLYNLELEKTERITLDINYLLTIIDNQTKPVYVCASEYYNQFKDSSILLKKSVLERTKKVLAQKECAFLEQKKLLMTAMKETYTFRRSILYHYVEKITVYMKFLHALYQELMERIQNYLTGRPHERRCQKTFVIARKDASPETCPMLCPLLNIS